MDHYKTPASSFNNVGVPKTIGIITFWSAGAMVCTLVVLLAKLFFVLSPAPTLSVIVIVGSGIYLFGLGGLIMGFVGVIKYRSKIGAAFTQSVLGMIICGFIILSGILETVITMQNMPQ